MSCLHEEPRQRMGYRHDVLVPESTNNRLIFPVDHAEGKFDLSFYDPEMTEGTSLTEEIQNFLEEIDPLVKPIFNSRLNSFLKCYDVVFSYLMFVLFILLGVGIFLQFYFGFQLFRELWVIFGGMLFNLLFAMIINCVQYLIVKSLIKNSKNKITPILWAKNPEFKRRGYFWVAPQDFPYWIELWRETTDQKIPEMSEIVNMHQQYDEDYIQEMPSYGKSPYNKDGYIEMA